MGRYLQAGAAEDRVFADAVRLASSIAGTTMAALTLIDADHLWFVATTGFEARRIGRSGTFCERTVQLGERFVVHDALLDPDFAERSFVTDEARMRFYAGLPITSRDGRILGTLCVADQRPNVELSADQFRHLALVLEVTCDRLEQRCAVAERDAVLLAAKRMADKIESETDSLFVEAQRLNGNAQKHELATDAAAQGVRQIILLDREIRATLAATNFGEETKAAAPSLLAIEGQLAFHDVVTSAAEEDIDALVGSAAALRVRSSTFAAQTRRLTELSSVLAGIVSHGRGGQLAS